MAFYEDTAFVPYRRIVSAGEVLFRQEGRDGTIGILVRGALEVARDGYIVGEVMEPGALLGEMALVLNSSHTTTVTALTDGEIILIPRKQLGAVSKKIPEFSMLIMRTLAHRLEQSNSRIAELENSYDQLYNQMESGAVLDTDETGLFNSATVVLDRPAELLDTLHGIKRSSVMKSEDANLPETLPEGRQPLIGHAVTCPCHDDSEPFFLYLLRKGSQGIQRDPYGITEYVEDDNEYAPLDYTLQEMHVCPVCLFASNSPDNFISTTAKSNSGFFSIRNSVKEMLHFGLDVRKALVQTLPDPEELFGTERGVREAMVSYELALMTARTFFETDRALFSSWGFRLIIYNLKLAQIQRRYRTRETEEIYLRRAYDLVRENLGEFTGAQHLYTYFLAVALAKRLETENKAKRYLEQFDQVRKTSSGLIDNHLGVLCDEYYSKAADVLDK